MKIVYITNVRIPTPRAQGYAIMKMCEEFGRLGNTVELLVPNRKDSDGIGEPFGYYKIEKNFDIKKVSSSDFLSRTFNFGRFFYWLDIGTFIASLFFRNVVKKGDIVYTRDFLVPLIFSHDDFVCLEVHDIPKMKFLFRYILKKPKMFFVLNQYIKKSLVEFGVSDSIIHIVPSGVDVKMYDSGVTSEEARHKLSLPQDKEIVVYTGHFYQWKGVDTLVEVAKKMQDKLFVFVGGVDPELSRLRLECSGLANVIIVPHGSRSIVPLYLKAADVLVVPNSQNSKISSEYTSPLKLLEYMASGKPIVASDLPSIREILNESNSVLAMPDNSKSLAGAISKVLSDPELASRISIQAKHDVVKYDWSNRAKKIIKFIEAEN